MKKNYQIILFFIFLCGFILLQVFAMQFSALGHVLFMSLWMISWWIAELIPLGITALIPLFYLPMINFFSIKEAAVYYSDPVIFLFLGGFMLAQALEKTKLNEVMANYLLKVFGKSDRGVLLAFIMATSFLSMWISNTATTMMMIPVASAVLLLLKKNMSPDIELKNYQNYAAVLMLCISYSSSIGGLMTPIGTPPNMVFVGLFKEMTGQTISFAHWMLATVPVSISILAAMYFLMCYGPLRFKIPFTNEMIKKLHHYEAEQTNFNIDQKFVLLIFCLMSFFWIFKIPLNHLIGKEFIDDNITAIFFGFVLFSFPIKKIMGKKLKIIDESDHTILNHQDISLLPWNVILLFGGGMCMAAALGKVGALEKIIESLQNLDTMPLVVLIFAIVLITVFLTEIMSNVALCAVMIPILITWARLHHQSTLLMGLLVALSISFGFSLPMSTPPNALVFGTGMIKFKQMIKIGMILNIVASIIITLIAVTWWQYIL